MRLGRRYLSLAVILLGYLVIGFLFATRTPSWQAPDEPAHYNYVRQLAAGAWPVIESTDYDERYRNEAVSSGFAAEYPIEPLSYEDWQPPLYYLALTPIYLLFDGALLPLRLTSLLLGLAIVVAAHAVASHVWPDKHWLALTATAFVAFLPQHLAILSSVNNDSLSELIIALILWSLASIASKTRSDGPVAARQWLSLGMLLGLGFLTKLTVYIMAPVILVTLLLLHWKQWSTLWNRVLLVFVPASLVGAVWWLRNIAVYDGLDPLAIMAHDAVVVGQTRTGEWLATYGVLEFLERFALTTFRSFWGQFGWMGVLMDARIYQLLLLFSSIVFVGLLWRFAADRSGQVGKSLGRNLWLLRRILLVTFLMNVVLYAGYNLTFVQHQGRYLFAALIPIALAVAAGLEMWIRPLATRWPSLTSLVPLLFAMALVGLDLLALFRYIVPQLAAL